MNKKEQLKYINEATKHITELFSKSNTDLFLPNKKACETILNHNDECCDLCEIGIESEVKE